MYKKICITSRQIAGSSLLEKIEKADADLVILREKDLPEAEYKALARQVIKLCGEDKKLILHTFIKTARELDHPYIHLTCHDFLTLPDEDRAWFKIIGVSTHSVEEAVVCEKMGASYITASHIFETKCKEGLKPRGLDYLSEVCKAVSVPVYALGGIHPDNRMLCINAGASGVCMMSEYMK